jgi:hypothetical protein
MLLSPAGFAVNYATSLIPRSFPLFCVQCGERSIKWTGNQHTDCANHDPSRQDTLICATIFSGPVVALHPPLRPLNTKHVEAVKHWEMSTRRAGANARRATETSTLSGVKNITSSNPKASGAYARVHARRPSFSEFLSAVR